MQDYCHCGLLKAANRPYCRTCVPYLLTYYQTQRRNSTKEERRDHRTFKNQGRMLRGVRRQNDRRGITLANPAVI
jgi:hypothetical protein